MTPCSPPRHHQPLLRIEGVSTELCTSWRGVELEVSCVAFISRTLGTLVPWSWPEASALGSLAPLGRCSSGVSGPLGFPFLPSPLLRAKSSPRRNRTGEALRADTAAKVVAVFGRARDPKGRGAANLGEHEAAPERALPTPPHHPTSELTTAASPPLSRLCVCAAGSSLTDL